MASVSISSVSNASFNQRVQYFTNRALPPEIKHDKIDTMYEVVPQFAVQVIDAARAVCNDDAATLDTVLSHLESLKAMESSMDQGVLFHHVRGILHYKTMEMNPQIMLPAKVDMYPVLKHIWCCCGCFFVCQKNVKVIDFEGTEAKKLERLTSAKDSFLKAYENARSRDLSTVVASTSQFAQQQPMQAMQAQPMQVMQAQPMQVMQGQPIQMQQPMQPQHISKRVQSNLSLSLAKCYADFNYDSYKRAHVTKAHVIDEENMMALAAKEAQDVPYFLTDVNVSSHTQNVNKVSAYASATASARAISRIVPA